MGRVGVWWNGALGVVVVGGSLGVIKNNNNKNNNKGSLDDNITTTIGFTITITISTAITIAKTIFTITITILITITLIGGGGDFRTGNSSHEKISHRVHFTQWPENPAGNFAPFQDCTVYYWAVPALHCQIPGLFREFPRASRIAFFTFWGFLGDLVFNPMPQGPRQSSPFICFGAQ